MLKELVKTATPKVLWETAKSTRDQLTRARFRHNLYLPWIRRVLMPGVLKRAGRFADRYNDAESVNLHSSTEEENPLREYARSYSRGPGFWKWDHFYEAYHRHLKKFVGQAVSLCEIGVFSGGSLDMWTAYFGDRCHVHGIDLEPACKTYERDNVTIHIGDQEDRRFWSSFKQLVPRVDVLVDDGGHTPWQQIVTLEEMLPFLTPGGVYICEDIYGVNNRFASYVAGLVDRFNAKQQRPDAIGVRPTQFQRYCHSLHVYPYLLVIEKHAQPIDDLVCPKRGTEWSPFYRHP